ELGEAADAVGAAPEMAIAVEAGNQPAAQIVPQHAVPVAGVIDEPDPAAAAARHRDGTRSTGLGIEPARIRLPQLRLVEQNRAEPARAGSGAERRQALCGVENCHASESNKLVAA